MFDDGKIYLLETTKQNYKITAEEARKTQEAVIQGKNKFMVIKRINTIINLAYFISITPFELTKEGKEIGTFGYIVLLDDLYPEKKLIPKPTDRLNIADKHQKKLEFIANQKEKETS